MVQACTFKVDYVLEIIPGREFGSVFIANAENVALTVAAKGWAKVRLTVLLQLNAIQQAFNGIFGALSTCCSICHLLSAGSAIRRSAKPILRAASGSLEDRGRQQHWSVCQGLYDRSCCKNFEQLYAQGLTGSCCVCRLRGLQGRFLLVDKVCRPPKACLWLCCHSSWNHVLTRQSLEITCSSTYPGEWLYILPYTAFHDALHIHLLVQSLTLKLS